MLLDPGGLFVLRHGKLDRVGRGDRWRNVICQFVGGLLLGSVVIYDVRTSHRSQRIGERHILVGSIIEGQHLHVPLLGLSDGGYLLGGGELWGGVDGLIRRCSIVRREQQRQGFFGGIHLTFGGLHWWPQQRDRPNHRWRQRELR